MKLKSYLALLLFLCLVAVQAQAEPVQPGGDNGPGGMTSLQDLRLAVQQQPDAAAYEALLRGLREGGGSAIELAMTAEEAVARHPDNLIFLRYAVEALLAVDAPDLALQYWQRIPKAEHGAGWANLLLGGIHEANGRIVEAWRAFQAAAATEAQAKAALERLAARSIALDGQQYFPPQGWVPILANLAELFHETSGARASIALLSKTSPEAALLKTLERYVPVPPQVLAAALAPAQPEAAPPPGETAPVPNGLPNDPGLEFLRIERLACTGMICVEAGPGPDQADLLPRLQAAALAVGEDTLVVLVQGLERQQAIEALQALASADRLVMGAKP
jgi:hypothetical protein